MSEDGGDPQPSEDLDEQVTDDIAVDVVVVGAGFAGLYMIYRLRQLGLTVKIIEAGSSIGGTWFWNRYPGARCDVLSLEYSYSFSPELQQEWDWPEMYSAQPDILSYLNHVATRFDLTRDIQFDTKVVGCHFHDATARWQISTDRGERYAARFCVMATGALSLPRVPSFPGLDTFAGEWHHTGNWPHDPVDLTGKSVGVIGTGSSGIQLIPIVARQAAYLTVFQRTPSYSVPARNKPLQRAYDSWFKANYDKIRQRAREGSLQSTGDALPIATPPDERLRVYEERWGLSGMQAYGAFRDLLNNTESNNLFSSFVRRKIFETVADSEIAAMLIPDDYAIGTKRVCVDTEYFETYNRDNVSLVDIRATPIVEIVPAGIRTTKNIVPLDTILFATGFSAMTGALLDIDIVGRDNIALRDKWSINGPVIHLGLMTANFPNLFMINAPGSPSVLGNVIMHIEHHIDLIINIIETMKVKNAVLVEPHPDAELDWITHAREVASATLYPSAKSWYVWNSATNDKSILMPYVGGFVRYAAECSRRAGSDAPDYIYTK